MERKSCYEIGIVEKESQVLARDLMILRGGRKYVLCVGTPQFRSELVSHRAKEVLSPPTEHEILVMDNIASVEEICQRVSSMPFEALQPYLTEQLLEEASNQ